MKHLSLLLAVFLNAPSVAQQWCMPGARWYHDEFEYTMWGYASYVETYYAGDTLIADSLCQELSYTHYYFNDQSQMTVAVALGNFYTASSPGIVRLWDGSGFDTLFHFAANPGDYWGVPDDEMRITVMDTGHSVIDGQLLRYQVVQVTYEDMTIIGADTVFERFGPLYMYPYITFTTGIIIDGGFHGLRCYSDDEITYTRVNGHCDIGLGVDIRSRYETAAIFPNPGRDRIWLDGLDTEGMLLATIYDMQGAIVASHTILPRTEIDVSMLARGLYAIVLLTSNGGNLRLEWVKE